MATECRHMKPAPSHPTSGRATVRTSLVMILPFLALGMWGCGGDDGGDGTPEGAATDPPTADEIRAGGSNDGPDEDSGAEATEPPAAPGNSTGSTASSSGGSAPAPSPSAVRTVTSSTDPAGPPYAVQLGAFERESNAQRLQESLEDAGFPVWTGETGTSGTALLRVRVGATSTVADARRLLEAIRSRLPDAPDSVWIAPLGTEGGASEEMMSATRALLEND